MKTDIMLSVQEVRERLRDGRPVILNEEANWNNQQKITKEILFRQLYGQESL